MFDDGFDAGRLVDPTTKQVTGIEIHPRWKNSGKTPAKDAVTWTAAYWQPEPISETFDFPHFDQSGRVITGHAADIPTGFPPESSQLGDGPVIALDKLLSAKDRTLHIYIYGDVRYRDVFEDTPPHLTEFCYELVETKVPLTADAAPTTVKMIACKWHNCFDETCPQTEQQNSGLSPTK